MLAFFAFVRLFLFYTVSQMIDWSCVRIHCWCCILNLRWVNVTSPKQAMLRRVECKTSLAHVEVLQWVCISARISTHPNFTRCSVHVNGGRGSVLLWQQYTAICTSESPKQAVLRRAEHKTSLTHVELVLNCNKDISLHPGTVSLWVTLSMCRISHVPYGLLWANMTSFTKPEVQCEFKKNNPL